MKITVTSHGFAELDAVLDSAAEDVIPEGKKVVGQGCRNIQMGTRRRWSGLAHLPHLPRAVTYDVKARGSLIDGEVGPDRARTQGKLGWIPELGSPTSAPRPGLAPELMIEAPKFERFVGDLGEKLLDR